jgi:hypothetical protein
MKKQFFVLTFIGSITLGWLTRSGVSAVKIPPAAKTSLTQPERKTREDQIQNTREAEFKTFVKRIPTLSDEDRVAYSKNLAPQDRVILVESILSQGDPSGHSDEFYPMVKSIMEIWATEDFEGAWAWSQKLHNKSWWKTISCQLLYQLEKKNPARALALYLEMGADGYFLPSLVPQHALAETTLRNANDFIELLGKLPLCKGDTRYGGPDCEFAKDFDFQRAVEGTTALAERRKQFPDQFPTNFIKSWAEHDPDAAFACWVNNQDFSPYGFNSLLDGVEKNNVKSMPDWVAGKMEESEKYRNIIIENMVSSSANSITGISGAITNSVNRDRFLIDVTLLSAPRSSFDLAKTFSEMSSPQVRLETLSKIQEIRWSTRMSEKISEAQYQAWGFTKQQAEALVPTNKEN